MAQTTILASGSTRAVSTAVIVASGGSASIGIFPPAAALLPANALAFVYQTTPGGNILYATLNPGSPRVSVNSAGTFTVERQDSGATIGAFSEP